MSAQAYAIDHGKVEPQSCLDAGSPLGGADDLPQYGTKWNSEVEVYFREKTRNPINI